MQGLPSDRGLLAPLSPAGPAWVRCEVRGPGRWRRAKRNATASGGVPSMGRRLRWLRSRGRRASAGSTKDALCNAGTWRNGQRYVMLLSEVWWTRYACCVPCARCSRSASRRF